MTLKETFLAQLEAEGARTRKSVSNIPENRDDWKPHERSMPFGRLAGLVARMPSWIDFIVNRDDLELSPPSGQSAVDQRPLKTAADYIAAVDESIEKGRAALENTTDEHLMKPWKLLVNGNVVSEELRHIVIRDTFAHLAHHRGQLTVYLRMNESPVPAIYGPSADDSTFA